MVSEEHGSNDCDIEFQHLFSSVKNSRVLSIYAINRILAENIIFDFSFSLFQVSQVLHFHMRENVENSSEIKQKDS